MDLKSKTFIVSSSLLEVIMVVAMDLYPICKDSNLLYSEIIYVVYVVFIVYFVMICASISFVWVRLEIYDFVMLWCDLCLNLVLYLSIRRVGVLGD